MSNIYTSADQLIGKTPLLELTNIEKEEGLEATVLAKLEYFNRALYLSSPPPATPASASPPSPRPAATASSSSCPRP